MSKLVLPPLQTPLVDQNGIMTKPWLDFFTDMAAAVEAQRTVSSDMKDDIANLRTRVEALEP